MLNQLATINSIWTQAELKSNYINSLISGMIEEYLDIFVFLDRIHPFADGNDKTCKILIDDKIENFYKIYKVT